MRKVLYLFGMIMIFSAGSAWAGKDKQGKKPTAEEIAASTTPVGSPFYRHLADDFNIDIRELVKFERKGFSRTEIITLVLLSDSDVKKLKEMGNRRIKEHTPMDTFVQEAGLEYRSLLKVVRQIKQDIEERGDKNLPPPVFEKSKEEKK